MKNPSEGVRGSDDDEGPPTGDRREFTRVSLRVQVEVIPPSGPPILGWTSDLSMGGWFVLTETDLPVGTVCEVRLLAPDGGEVLATGRIVRRGSRGLGGELLHMDLSSMHNLGRILRLAPAVRALLTPSPGEQTSLPGPQREAPPPPWRPTAIHLPIP